MSVPTAGIKESSLVWPMLTRSNYVEWSMLMKINFEAMEIWEVIDPGTNVRRSQDRQMMGALMRSVPKEMWGTLGAKQIVKEAWEAVMTMRIGADRVKDVNTQKLLKEFENIDFKEGETVEDFGMRITSLVTNIRSLGETIDDTRVVKKFLRVVPTRFNQVVVSIEMFCDVKALTVEDLVGRLRAAEERFEDKVDQVTDKTGRLLLAEEEWLEKINIDFRQTQQTHISQAAVWEQASGSQKHQTMLMVATQAILVNRNSHQRVHPGEKVGVTIVVFMDTAQLTASVQKRTKRANNNLNQMWLLKVKNMELSYSLN